MSTLELIKEYIDAKADYERYGLNIGSGALSPSSSLTPAGQAIVDRYINAETNLNLAIEAERKQSLTSAP